MSVFGSTRTVKADITANVDGYLSGLRRASAATKDFYGAASRSSGKHKQEWGQLANGALVAGAAIGAVVAAAVKKYADFEAAMSRVAAVAGASAGEQRALADAALDAGQATVFSATEAAKAQEELAKAGVRTADILGGALRGSLDLAAAGGLDLAKSAEISAQAMNIFGLQGKDVAHIADVLTAGANKSAAGVDDLGMALSQGGLMAKQTGLSLEDTVGALSAFADNALKGSDAGTSMKTMLQRLNPQSDEAARLMDDLGLRAYDAQGNFVGLAEYSGKLQSALSGMSAEQRNAALSTLFGADAVRAATILYQQGEAGIRKYIAGVDDQGAAQRMAARMTDNLKGDIEQLGGAIETALIKGGSGGAEGLRSIAQAATGAVQAFSGLPDSLQQGAVQAAALAAAALLVAGGLGKAMVAASEAKAAMAALGLTTGKTAVAMKGAAAAAGVFAVAWAAITVQKSIGEWRTASVEADRLANSLYKLADGGRLAGGAADLFANQGALLVAKETYVSAGEAIERFTSQANTAVNSSFWGDLWDGIAMNTQAAGRFDKTVRQLDAGFAAMVQNGNAESAKKSLEALLAGVDPDKVDEVRAKFELYQEALDNVSLSAQDARPELAGLTSEQKAAQLSAESAADATAKWSKALSDINSPLLDARSAARDFEAAIDDATAAVKENGKTLDINTEKGRANQAALDGVASSAISQISALQANGASQGELQATLARSRDRLVATAIGFGMSRAAAERYADSVLAVPTSTSTTAHFNDGAAESAVERLRIKLDGLNGKTVSTYVNVINRQYGQSGASTQGGLLKWSGGYTGDGGKYEPKGTVHGGEFVMTKERTAQYRSLFEFIHAGGDPSAYYRRGFADGGYVGRAQAMRVAPTPSAPASAGGFDSRAVAAVEAAVERGIIRGSAQVRFNFDGRPLYRNAARHAAGMERA